MSPYSISSPKRKKAVLSEIRVACCMLCVTITIVVSALISRTSSSILPVETGSSALVGSSISRMSGFTASARAMQSRCCCPPVCRLVQAVFKLVPHGGGFKRTFDYLVKLAAIAYSERFRSVAHVFVHAHREGIGLLEHHAHAFTKRVQVCAFVVNIRVANHEFTLYPATVHKVVHAVEALQKGRFAAAAGSYECGNFFFGNCYVYVFKCLKVAVPQVRVGHRNILPERAYFLFIFHTL